MATILSVLGTRPEGIKMAPVVQELARRPSVRSVVVSTGQHREMLDQVLRLFGIRPDVELNLMRADQTLTQLTAALFLGLDGAVRDARPDWVIAQGDTTTVMVAALVAFYHRVPFGHVEAGLRTGDYGRPFPEEMNRRIADLAAAAYFAPTSRAVEALHREGIAAERVHKTGNTVIDALLQVAAMPFTPAGTPLEFLAPDHRLVLVTAHRRESFGEPFRELCAAIRDLALEFENEGVQVLYPVHLNPKVRQPVAEVLGGIANVRLVEPLDYFTMVHAMRRASLVLTDSGGVQEEAPSFGARVLVMRDTTERPEGVEAGVVRLVGTRRAVIVAEAAAALRNPEALPAQPNPYGDGKAAQRIVRVLLGERPE